MTSRENMSLIVTKYSDSNEVVNPDFQNIAFPYLDVFPCVVSMPVSMAIMFKTELGSLMVRDLFF